MLSFLAKMDAITELQLLINQLLHLYTSSIGILARTSASQDGIN